MITGLITLLIYILVVGLIVWLALYVISVLPMPAPFGQIARVLVIVVGCIIIIMLLLNLVGDVPSVSFDE